MGARRRALPDDDVQLVILERRVKLLFQHRLHAVDLVQEQHLPLPQVGQDGGEVALDLQRRPRRLLEADVQLVRDDGCQRGLAQSGRPEQQHMIQRLAARLGRLQRDRKLLLGLGLPDELPQPPRPQLQLEILLFLSARSADQPFRRVVARDRHAGEKCSRWPVARQNVPCFFVRCAAKA